VKEIYGELVAIDAAFSGLKAGELCLILINQVEESLRYINNRVIAG
jgi:cyanophycin synthetase